jgi:hypothetical protein
MSMAHSLEARVPFFDVDYISTAMAVNPAKKLIRKVSSSVDIESFSTKDYAGQIPNRGLWLAILLLWL